MEFLGYVITVYSKYINLLYLFKTYYEFNVTVYVIQWQVKSHQMKVKLINLLDAYMEICYSFAVRMLNYQN